MKTYDITSKITNELPTIKITDDLICTINNRKTNVLTVLAKVKEDGQNKDNFETIEEAMKLLVGEKSAKAIENMDLPAPEYVYLFKCVMAVAQGREIEEQTPSK